MYQMGALLLAYHKVYFIERGNLNQKGIDENIFLYEKFVFSFCFINLLFSRLKSKNVFFF